MGKEEAYTGFWWGNLSERDHLGDPGVDGKILRWISRKWNVWVWTGSSWLRIETGPCESGNELSGFIKCEDFFD